MTRFMLAALAVMTAGQAPDGYVVEIDPCFSTVFASSAENIGRVEACIRGEGCDETPF